MRRARFFPFVVLKFFPETMTFSTGPTSTSTRWELARSVAERAIDLMHFADAINVLVLGKDDFDIADSILFAASDENREMLKQRLSRVEPKGAKFTTEGIQAAFLTLRRSQREETQSTGCQQV